MRTVPRYNEAMLWDLVGHEWAAEMLVKHIQNDAVKHAYIFYGQDGIGRRTLALHFAQALTCQNPVSPGIPCQKCGSCKRIARAEHPDLFFIKVPENGKEIRIDQMRSLQHDLSLAPFEAPRRIGLIQDFQLASESAQNAMLKTLEEPSPRSMLLLTASRPEDLLATIASRCEPMQLRPVSVDTVAIELEKRKSIEPSLARKAARLSGGCYGYAVYLVDHPSSMEMSGQVIDSLLRILSAPLRDRFAYAEEIAPRKPNARENLLHVLRIWLSFWRDAFVLAGGSNTPIIHSEYQSALDQLIRLVSLSSIIEQLDRLEKGIDQVDKNVNLRLLAEVLLLGLPRLEKPISIPT